MIYQKIIALLTFVTLNCATMEISENKHLLIPAHITSQSTALSRHIIRLLQGTEPEVVAVKSKPLPSYKWHTYKADEQPFNTARRSNQSLPQIYNYEKFFKCDQCSYSSTCSSYLTKHMRTHTNERPYPCTQCEFAFKLSHHLKNHMRTHTGEKAHQCDICQKPFSHPTTLKRHLLTHKK